MPGESLSHLTPPCFSDSKPISKPLTNFPVPSMVFAAFPKSLELPNLCPFESQPVWWNVSSIPVRSSFPTPSFSSKISMPGRRLFHFRAVGLRRVSGSKLFCALISSTSKSKSEFAGIGPTALLP